MIVGVIVGVDGDGDGDVAVGGLPAQSGEHRHDPFEEFVTALLSRDIDNFQNEQCVQHGRAFHRRPTSNGVIEKTGNLLDVVRVKISAATKRLPPLFETKTDVIEKDAVGVKAFTVRSVYCNELRRKVQDLPKL